MGRRYKNEVGSHKDTITYHVYRNGELISSIVGDKKAALLLKDNLEGDVEIRKTREQVKI